MDALIRALPKLIAAAGASEEVTEAAVRIAWRRVAGEPLCQHAVPFRVFRTTLVISVSDAIWQKQMAPLSAQMLSRLNALLGRGTITFIEFRIDPDTVQQERGQQQPLVPPMAAGEILDSLPDEIVLAANAIVDEALRRRFLLAAGANMKRQQDL